MGNKYFLVYIVDASTRKGDELCRRKDEYGTHERLHGFETKRKMLDWLDENRTGLFGYQMLKPIT